MVNEVIGLLMRLYRRTPLHSERAGKVLARILDLVMPVNKNQKKIKEIDGVLFELNLNQVIDSSLYYSGTFEEQVERLIISTIKPGMVAIDVGANIGYHTFRMAKLVTETGKVYAIEPTRRAYDKLLRNADLNPMVQNIRHLKLALSDADAGLMPMKFESSYRLDNNKDSTTEMVEILTLDSVVEKENISRVDFIKIDVDGFEAKVIKGALQTLSAARHPILLMEINPSGIIQNGDNPDEMIDTLAKFGYKFQTEHGRIIPDLKAYCRQAQKLSTMIFCQVSD